MIETGIRDALSLTTFWKHLFIGVFIFRPSESFLLKHIKILIKYKSQPSEFFFNNNELGQSILTLG